MSSNDTNARPDEPVDESIIRFTRSDGRRIHAECFGVNMWLLGGGSLHWNELLDIVGPANWGSLEVSTGWAAYGSRR